ncbi:MAG: transcriptional repressor [Peptococcaceae bacterium]|nr:transcriptional repressor [Peptococcaceae bacterium]
MIKYPEVGQLQNYIKDVEKTLKNGDFKLTHRRKAVLGVLWDNKDKHLSAEEVYNLVKEKEPDVGLATVYRTLELFSGFGIVCSMDFGDGRMRYECIDSKNEGHHHHHIICLKCGKILEMAEDLLDDLEARVSRELSFKVLDHQLKIFGHCSECK